MSELGDKVTADVLAAYGLEAWQAGLEPAPWYVRVWRRVSFARWRAWRRVRREDQAGCE